MPAPGQRSTILAFLLLSLLAASSAQAPARPGEAVEPKTGQAGRPRSLDPRLVYTRPLESEGGRGRVEGSALAVDAEGFAYVTGALDNDAFVAKLSPDGGSMVFLTLLGGSDDDSGAAIALGPGGDIFVTGVTRSLDFPGARGGRKRRDGATDAFVVRMSADGSRLLDTAILGGSGDDAGAGIAVDASGAVLVTGATSSYDFPATARALQPGLAGMDDAFVARLTAKGLRRIYATYLGGSGIDRGAAIALDAAGQAHVAGTTSSADFPVSESAQPVYGGSGRAGVGDGFVAKLDAAGSRLMYSTFLGGRDDDEITAIALDSQGMALVAGATSSDDMPTRAPVQLAPGGGADAFIARLNTAGDRLLTASYLGSTGQERATGLSVNSNGDIFVSGVTSSTGWPSDGEDDSEALGSTAGQASFVTRLRSGGRLGDSVRLDGIQRGGRDSSDLVAGIAAGDGGDLYLTGATRDSGAPASGLPAGDEGTGFVARLAFGTLAASCPGSMNFTNGGGTGLWEDPNNWDDSSRVPEAFDDVCIDAGFDVLLASGTHEVNSLASNGKLSLSGGTTTLTIDTDSQLEDFTMAGGTLNGAGAINIGGQFIWRGGIIEGPAGHASAININGTLLLDTAFAFRQISSRTFNIVGTVLHTAGGLTGGAGATINLMGTYRVSGGSIGSSAIVFNNKGLFEKTSATNFSVGIVFNNSGTVDVQQGNLIFGAFFTQTAGTTLLNGGNLSVQPMNLRGGILSGIGTITGNVLSAGGRISPGFSPGSLTIIGELVHGDTSVTDVEITGLTPGSGFDRIALEGTASVSLGGTLNVTLPGGFVPAISDRFDILTFASRTGTFATVNVPPPVNGVALDVSYSATAVSLVASTQKSANLSLDKLDSPDPVLRDRTLTYTLVVSNSGPDEGTDVRLLDALPSSTTLVSAAGPGWTCDSSTGPVICTLPVLAVGANSSVTIEVTPTLAPVALLNTATVTSNEKDPVPGNNTAQQATSISLSVADLAVTIADAPDPVRIDSDLTLAITVTNAGPETANPVRVTNTMPAGSTFVGFSGFGWGCLQGTGAVNCVSNAIAPGDSSSLNLTITSPSTGGDVVNTVVASSNASDPNQTDNVASTTTTVLPASADLSVTSSDAPDPVGTFDTLVYAMVVANAGPDPAHGLVLTDTLPVGCAFVRAMGSGWGCQHAAGLVTCTRNVLGPGASSLVEITVSAPGSGGTAVNTAAISSAANDPTPSNNTSNQNTAVVVSHADVSIAAVESADPVFAGEPLDFTLTVSNAGPNRANFLTATTTLSPGSTFMNAAGTDWTCSHASGIVTCTLASLEVGPAAPIQITTKAPTARGLIATPVSVAASTDDPNPPNNSSAAETIVFLPNANLSITVLDTPDPVVETGVVTYRFTVTNSGPDPVKTVKVVSTVPPGISFVSVPPVGGGWTCSASLPNVTCVAPEIPVGPLPAFNIGVPAPIGAGSVGVLSNIVAVVDDPDLSNNSVGEQTTIVRLGANMAANQSVTPDPVESGEEFTYTISATNKGPLPATGVQIVEVLPPEVEFVNAIPLPDDTQTEPNGALKLTYEIGDVPPNSVISVQATVRCVAPNPALVSTNTVEAVQFDPSTADNVHTKVTNCIGLNASVFFTQRSITPASTSLAMPAQITVPGAAIDPASVSISRLDDEPIPPIPGVFNSGKFNFNRQTLLRTIEGRLRACTPDVGVPVELRVGGRTTSGDFFTGTDTITYVKKSPCADGSTSCATLKPATLKATSLSTDPVNATIGLCLGRIIQGTVRVVKVNGIDVPSLPARPHPKKPDKVVLDRQGLNFVVMTALGFCPAQQIIPVTLTLRGLTQSLAPFEVTAPLIINCASGV